MFITDFSIKRPVFSVAISLMILIVGIMSYMNLSLQQYPDVEEPIITVSTKYSGAAASVIESKVTTPIENALSGVPNLDYAESSSTTGYSSITLYFSDGVSLATAAADVREYLSQVHDRLPEDCKEPRVSKKSKADSFMILVVSSSSHNELELYDYVDRYLKGQFESLNGVGEIVLDGNPMAMIIQLDRDKLKAYDIAVLDVIDVLKEGNAIQPAGNIIKGKRHVNIITTTGLDTPKEMGELVISNINGHVVLLKDVAEIRLGKDEGEFQWLPRFDQKAAVFIGIKKASKANMLEISEAVQKEMNSLRESLPEGMKIEVGYNFSKFIKASIKGVQFTIFEAIILVLLIILFFLHSPRAAIIPLLTIPVSLIGAFAFLYAFNCSINTITLLAMVLAIGLVVDDAIVVLENIHRHMEEGLNPMQASLKGAREVGFAVIAMTLTLASVYAPIAFVQGLTGQLFSEFAIALGGAVLISGFVALTLTPMMCSKLLQPKRLEKQGQISKKIEAFLSFLDTTYQRNLRRAFASPKLLLGVIFVFLMAGVFLFYSLSVEIAPQEDEGIVISWTQGPEGATFESMEEYTPKIEGLLSAVPEMHGLFSATARSGVFAGITLKPWSERKRTQTEIIEELRKKTQKIAGVQVFVFPMRNLLTGGQSGLQMAFKTKGSYENLENGMNKLVKKLKKSSCFEDASHDLFLSTPQINIEIDRNKAALLGVKVEDVGKTLNVMLNGDRSVTFEQDGKSYDIVVQAEDDEKNDISDIGKFFVKSETNDELIPISNLIILKEIAVPPKLKHINKMRSAVLGTDLSSSCGMGTALEILKAEVKESLPPTVQMESVGNLRKFMESQGAIFIMFFAALCFIYLVLAIQFESFLDPLLIMVTVPLSMVGALLALYLTGGTLNIFSQVGLITLVGLITKHGILIVEFANKQRDHGLSIEDAIFRATALRLRPILMTTGAMVLGAVPLALASGAGAVSRAHIGWVLVGGLLGGTLFTLFAVPFAYVKVKEFVERRW